MKCQWDFLGNSIACYARLKLFVICIKDNNVNILKSIKLCFDKMANHMKFVIAFETQRILPYSR